MKMMVGGSLYFTTIFPFLRLVSTNKTSVGAISRNDLRIETREVSFGTPGIGIRQMKSK